MLSHYVTPLPSVSNLLTLQQEAVTCRVHTKEHAIKLQKEKKKTQNVLSNFIVLCWAAFIVILGLMQPVGQGLDTLVEGET